MATLITQEWLAPASVPSALSELWVEKGLTQVVTPTWIATKYSGIVFAAKTGNALGLSTARWDNKIGISSSENTLFCIANLAGTAPDAVAFGRLRYSGSANYGCGIRFNATSLECDKAAGGSAWTYSFTSSQVTTGRNSYAATVTSSTYPRLFKNGVELAVSNAGSSPAGTAIAPWDTSLNAGQGDASGATAVTAAINGVIEVGLHFSKALTPADIAALHANWWVVMDASALDLVVPNAAAPGSFIPAWIRRGSQVIGAGVH